jgi:hypothetical protein
MAAKKDSLDDTSLCVLLPKWMANRHPLLKSMQLIAEYGTGYHLFGQGNKRLPGTKWPMQAYFDPPAVPHKPDKHGQLAMHYKCSIAGRKATCLLDTGAQGSHYVSKRFCLQHGIAITPTTGTILTMLDKSTCEVVGETTVAVHLQGYHDRLKCEVMDMVGAYDLILGNEWLDSHNALIDMETKRCTISTPLGRLTLQSQKSQITEAPGPANDSAATVISGIQLRRMLRRKRVDIHALVLVRHVSSDRAGIVEHVSCVPPVAGGQPDVFMVPPDQIEALLKRYDQVFKSELPGLPPWRDVPPCDSP